MAAGEGLRLNFGYVPTRTADGRPKLLAELVAPVRRVCGAPGLRFYTMNQARPTLAILAHAGIA